MRVKGSVRWSLYLLFVAINSVLLELYIVSHQAGSGIGNDLYRGVGLYYNDDKPKELLGYIIGISIVFMIFIVFLIGDYRKNRKVSFARKMASVSGCTRLKRENIAYFSHFILLPAIIYYFVQDSKLRVYFQVYIVLYHLYLAIRPSVFARYKSITMLLNHLSYIVPPLMVMLIIQIVYVFMNHITGPPEIINEFYNIPESTRVGGVFVDNTDYYNNRLFKGRALKWDVEKSFESNKALFYDDEVSDKNHYVDNIFDEKKMDEEEKKFISDNIYEFHWQILGRYMYHHHSFVYVPLSDYELGVPLQKINAQYGLGNIMIFNWLLSKMGGVSIENWLKINAWFYVIYYLLFAIILFSVIDMPIYAISVFALSLVLLYMHGYEFLILAPGDSPWRHLADIVILFLFYDYQRRKKDYLIYIALLLALLSVMINPQIGFMISLATTISLLIFLYLQKMLRLVRVVMVFVIFFSSIVLFILFSSGGDLVSYYLKGVIGFSIQGSALFYMFLFVLMGYAILIYMIKRNLCEKCLSMLYLFFYSQGLLVYYVWHSDVNGLLARSHIYLLTV